MRILAGLFAVAAWLIPASAPAVTPDELVRLRDAGLGDEVLLALIDTTGVQGRMDAAGALENRYFHSLNDGVAIPPAPDRPASHTRR